MKTAEVRQLRADRRAQKHRLSRRAKKNIRITVLCILALALCFFTTDLVRAKVYSLPPVFCIQSPVNYQNGSVDYYGLGYKVWKDYHPFDKTAEYCLGFWFIPKFLSI